MHNDTTPADTHRAEELDARRTTTGGLVPLDCWADSFGRTAGERHDEPATIDDPWSAW
jgi:hypothetical protein